MKNIKLPSNEVILYTLALGGALTFAYAFLTIDGASLLSVSGVILLLRGLVIGAAAGLGIAKISHALPRIQSKNARRYTAIAFAAMLTVAVPIVASVTYSRMSPEMLALPPWVRVAVSLSVALFVDALTAGVALSSGKLEADDKPAQSEPQSETKPPKAKDKPAFVCSCGYVAKSQAALSGHQLAHKPKKAEVLGYEVALKPITKPD